VPRFVEWILKFISHWVTTVVGICILALLAYVYNKPRAQASLAPDTTYVTPGTRPSEDAGVLGGIAAQRRATAAMLRQIEQLQARLDRVEVKPKPDPREAKLTAQLEAELKTLQAQVAQGQHQRQTAPSADSSSRLSLRRIGPVTTGGETRPPRTSGIQVARPNASWSDTSGPVAPYLPPQSVARGRVKDGYTGLASLETFPVTLDVTSAFSAPNGHSVPLAGCRFGATATPEELTARGRLQLTRLTCVTETGRTIERPISGYATAYDNMNGQIAQVFWHERDVLAAFGKSAVPTALVSLFEETRQVVDVATLTGVVVSTGDTVAQDVARRMADIYLDKAEKLASPIIWVGPDTPVYLYITEGARLDGFQTLAANPQPLARRMMR